jgi:hypothetical protein
MGVETFKWKVRSGWGEFRNGCADIRGAGPEDAELRHRPLVFSEEKSANRFSPLMWSVSCNQSQ